MALIAADLTRLSLKIVVTKKNFCLQDKSFFRGRQTQDVDDDDVTDDDDDVNKSNINIDIDVCRCFTAPSVFWILMKTKPEIEDHTEAVKGRYLNWSKHGVIEVQNMDGRDY